MAVPVIHSCGHPGVFKASPKRQPPSILARMLKWMAENPCPKCYFAACKVGKEALVHG